MCVSLSNHQAKPSLTIFFFFNDTATTEIYTLSLHDALPIWRLSEVVDLAGHQPFHYHGVPTGRERSEEHTSELQSRLHLVCRLLLEKKKKQGTTARPYLIEHTRSFAQARPGIVPCRTQIAQR